MCVFKVSGFVCMSVCLCLFRWVSRFLRFNGGCVCVFVWIFVCVCSNGFLAFEGLMVGVCVCLCGFLFVFVSMGFWVFKV